MSKYEPSRPPRNIIVLLLLAMLALVGCGDGKSVRQLPHLGNTPYQQDTILMTYATNPERALTLLDSALLLGNISEYRGQVIRAKIYSKSLTEQRLDSAILICEALLEHDSVRNEPAEQENILDLLIATSRAKPEYEQYIQWATQKAKLCQQQGQETERWRTEADIGLVMMHLGQENKGLAKLDETIGHLDAPGSIDRMPSSLPASVRSMRSTTCAATKRSSHWRSASSTGWTTSRAISRTMPRTATVSRGKITPANATAISTSAAHRHGA